MGGGSMSERLTVTRTAERLAVSKAPEADAEGWRDYAFSGSPEAVDAWMKGAGAALDVIGPWRGSLADGEADRAVIVVRTRDAMATPRNLALFDRDAARGLLGVWAGR
jgi:hypothetical protein